MTASRSLGGPKERVLAAATAKDPGAEAFPTRIERYAKAKRSALNVSKYTATKDPALAAKMQECGNFLLFRHFYTVNKFKLHAANFCKKHMLCQLCALRRGAKALAAYMPRYNAITAENAQLRPYLITLTVKNGSDLAERFRHLHKAQRELWKRKQRKDRPGRTRNPTAFDGIAAAVWSYEVKRGKGSDKWHPHLHMVALAPTKPDAFALSAEWHNITGDSRIVDVRAIDTSDPVSGFCEVFKYALKFSDLAPADCYHAFTQLRGKRLVASAGFFRGIDIPEDLTDTATEDLTLLPYIEILARFADGKYELQHRHTPYPLPPAKVQAYADTNGVPPL